MDWIEVDMSSRVYSSTYYLEDEANEGKDIVGNILLRCLKYGKLDHQSQIARKTGAISKDMNYEKDQNIYDQNDSFIDDEVDDKIIQSMIVLESGLADYQMIDGNLETFKKSPQYKERLQILKKHSHLTPDPKTKSAKKSKKSKQKTEQVVEQNAQQVEQQ